MEILLNTLKWSGAVGGAALALTALKPLLDRRYSAKWRYGAWLALAALLLLAPVPWDALLPETPVEPPVLIQAPRVEVSVSRQSGLSLEVRRPAGTPPRPVESGENGPAVFPLETVLTALWLSGGALFLLYHLAGTWRFTRRARRWSRSAGPETQGVYEAVRREMGLGKVPPLRVSAAVGSPMVAGLLRPALLLPGEDFGVRELGFILRHELTHYRRRDLWYKLVLLAANALHWFNPLVWLLRREAERDLELTCDDAVVSGAGGETRRAYSEALMACVRPQRERSVLSTHFYGGKAVMKERFRNILGGRGRKWGAGILAAALVATVGAACAFGVRSGPEALSPEELAEWQTTIYSPEMGPYLSRMYSDAALLPPEELRGGESRAVRATVTGGTKEGDRVSLELEGSFPNGLTQGTLTLEDGRPVSFTTPLYTVVESQAQRLMDLTAQDYIQWAKADQFITGDLEFPEKYVTDLKCVESQEFDGTAYYVWTLKYRMKPNDMGNVLFAGGMAEENGWITEQSSMGTPCFIISLNEAGDIAVEEQTWTTRDGLGTEGGFTWEEYLYCSIHLGLGGLENGVYGGWPQISTPFLESLRDGHETWATDWEDTALTYLSRMYGLTAEGGVTLQYPFFAGETVNAHTQAVLVRADCGSRTALLLLTEIVYPVESWETDPHFWQVAGEKWTPDRPEETLTATVAEEPVPPADSMPSPTPNLPDTGTIPTPTPQPSAPDPAPMPQPDAPSSGSQSGVTAIPTPGPDIRTPTGTIGDFDGDGVRDEEVWIDGVYHRVLFDPETQDLRFDPPAPEYWENVSTTPPEG